MSICLNHIKETANSGTKISHFIQYPSVSEVHESGTNLVQKKSKAGKAPFYAASKDY